MTNLVYNNMKFEEEILVLFYLDSWIVSGWVLTTCLNQYSYAMARLYKWRVWKANSLIWLSWLSWWKLKSGLEVPLEKSWLFFESTRFDEIVDNSLFPTSTGYYMYIETSSPRKQGDNAKLNSPKLQFRGSMCLKFYYHMYGANIAKLNVIINGNNVFTASGDKGNKWLVAAIDVSLSGKHEVRDIIMPFGRCIVYSNCNLWVFFYGTRGQPQHMVLFFCFWEQHIYLILAILTCMTQ